MRPVVRGDRGKEVVDIQTRLRALGYFLGREGADGHFGMNTERAIREFQQKRLLLVDGVVGENTWTELVEAGYAEGERLLYLRVPFMRGDDVLQLQRRLNELGFDSGPEDGIFGPVTENALTEFQRNVGLNVDGILGEASLAQLRRVRKAELGAQGKKIPDRMNGYVGKATLAGMRVSLDPAHGGADAGARGVRGNLEKDINLDLALRLARLLRESGAEVCLTRETDRTLGLYERAQLANAWQPDLHVCLHHNYAASPKARGAATYYFANGAYFAEAGKRLAGYVVKALVEELGRVDLHTHGRNYACLREVQSLSLMVEPAFVTHPEEGASLEDPASLEAEARAIMTGIRSFVERR
ncbi:MAG: N-acetylmuramoyl-L-alanine amidase [Thermoleophilia bacterium]